MDKTIPVVTQVMIEAPMPAVSLSVPIHVKAHAADNWNAVHLRAMTVAGKACPAKLTWRAHVAQRPPI
jgi:hypothetical protein